MHSAIDEISAGGRTIGGTRIAASRIGFAAAFWIRAASKALRGQYETRL